MTAEQSVLGSALIDPTCVPIVCGELTVEDFTNTANIETFKAIQSLWTSGSVVDLVTLSNELESRDAMEKAGGIERITELLTLTPTSANVRYYIEIVQEARRRRVFSTGIRTALSSAESGEDGYIDSARAVLDEASAIGSQGAMKIAEFIPAALNRLGDTTRGKSTGFTTLDIVTGGFQDGHLVIIGARPAVGKTALACNIAANMCRMKSTCAYFTVEMSREEITERILLSEAQANRYKSDAAQKVTDITDRVGKWDLYIDDRGSLSVGQIVSACYKFKQQSGKLDAVFVDYLQLLRIATRKNGTRSEDLGAASRALKILAKELKCPVIALSQLNRSSEGREPTIADLRESGSIEQDADLIFLLHRTEDAPNETTLIIGKNRSGAAGRNVKLVWNPEYTRFTEPVRR